MMQVSATFTDDCELEKLRDFAANCGLCQIGHVVRKPFYKRVKFQTIHDTDQQTDKQKEG